MTEAELAAVTQKRLIDAGLGNFTHKQVRTVLRMAGAAMATTLAEGNPVTLPNLGTISARRIVSFAPTAALRESLTIYDIFHTP